MKESNKLNKNMSNSKSKNNQIDQIVLRGIN